jgi:predicted alpha/beta superfamily hydrolase
LRTIYNTGLRRIPMRHFLFTIVWITCLICSPAVAEGTKPAGITDGTPLKLGNVRIIHSRVLDEDRPLFVALPPDYEIGNPHPVLYVMDGRTSFLPAVSVCNFLAKAGRMPSVIVVAVLNTNRNRDFTPVSTKGWTYSGGGDKFLDFMQNELIPFIDKEYRTTRFRIFSGHSLCGMFAVHVLTQRPGLFDDILAMSPAVGYENEYTLDQLEKLLKQPYPTSLQLFISLGNEPGYTKSLNRLTDLLKLDSAHSIQWKYREYPELTHGTIPFKSFYDGLSFVCRDWPLTKNLAEPGLEGLKQHFAAVNKRYGTSIVPSEAAINQLGYNLLQQSSLKKAIRVFEYNVGLHPDSANVYDSLGEALEASGDIHKALLNYSKAVKLAELAKDQNLQIFHSHLIRARKKLSIAQ